MLKKVSKKNGAVHFVLALALTGVLSAAQVRADDAFEGWIQNQYSKSVRGMMSNISRSDTARGVVVASPSKSDPDYFYHWVRDAGLVMEVVVSLYEKSPSQQEQHLYFQTLMDFVGFSRQNQMTPTLSPGLGEPKFYVDGRAYDRPWGRPQNDGPAIRASTLIRFANLLLAQGNEELVRKKLYRNEIPAHTVIKADLEFIAHHWRSSSFDPWEEVSGQHFYVRMVQRRALLEGAFLAFRLGDPGAAEFYLQQAELLQTEIMKHWDSGRNHLVATLHRDGGIDYKHSGLDLSIVLGALHGNTYDGFLSPSSDLILATAHRLRESFERGYAINQKSLHQGARLGTAIGRYPEDRYNGYTTESEGNPWVLGTAAFAELYFEAAREWDRVGVVEVTALNLPFLRSLGSARQDELRVGDLIKKGDHRFAELLQRIRRSGDEFLRRIQYHSNPDLSLAEQLNRYTGFQQGAPDLTWSYASFITAVHDRR